MTRITKSSLAQLAKEMHVLEGQEQKGCVGGANSTYSQFGNTSHEHQHLASLPNDLFSSQIGEDRDCETIFLENCDSTSQKLYGESISLQQALAESIERPATSSINNSGMGVYVGKEDGMNTYLLGEVVVTADRPYKPFGNIGPTGVDSYDIMAEGGYHIGYEAGKSPGIYDDFLVGVMSGIAYMSAGSEIGGVNYDQIYYADGLRRGLIDGQKVKNQE